MDTNSRRITLANAATLLLVLATLASCKNDHLRRLALHWDTWLTCERMIESDLPDGSSYSPDEYTMVQELNNTLNSNLTSDNELKKKRRIYLTNRLIFFANPAEEDICNLNTLNELVSMISMCGNEERFKRYADFLAFHAPQKLRPCAVEVSLSFDLDPNPRLENLVEEFNNFFKAALRVQEQELGPRHMYELLKEVNLAADTFDIRAMAKVATKSNKQGERWHCKSSLINMLEFFNNRCLYYKGLAMSTTKIVNLARDLEAIKERELTFKFLMYNEYVRLCLEFMEQKSYEMIKHNWKVQLKSTKWYTRTKSSGSGTCEEAGPTVKC